MNFSVSEKIVLELVKSALWKHDSELLSGSKLSDQIWNEVYSLSVSQGVLAIVFDGILRLPQSHYPPTELMLTWSVNVKLLEKRYNMNRLATEQLNNFFAERDVEMLLLKGLSLSEYYPTPAHREYGDIDIYLFGKEQTIDRSIQQLADASGRSVKHGVKHSSFYFRKIPVENHVSFLNINRFTTFFDKRRIVTEAKIETELLNLLRSQEKEWMVSGDNCKIRVPSATFNYIFLTCHTAMHLPRGIVLRHLCDWACFLYHNRDRYDQKRISEALEYSNFNCISSILTDMVIQYLGLPSQYAPKSYMRYKEGKLQQRVMLNILRPFPHLKSNNLFGRRWWSIERFFKEHWKYKMVYGDTLFGRAFRAFHMSLTKAIKIK